MAVDPVVLCLSASGEAVAHRIAAALGCAVHGREGRVARADLFFGHALDHARDLFAAGVPVIGVCASGILIRGVAPMLADKRAEPPVISVSDDGRVVVPLLGGHRGANRLARRIAAALDGTAAVTTAGDVSLGVALDEPPAGWRLGTPELAQDAMARLLSGAGAVLSGEAAKDAGWLAGLPSRGEGAPVEIAATGAPAAPGGLTFHPQRFALGVGCARDCPPEELEALVLGELAAAGVAAGALRALFTLDLKADEPAVIALAAKLGLPLRIFTAAELEAKAARLATPSEVVFAEVGCHGVCEGAALAGAGPGAVLARRKAKTAMATCALAEAAAPIVPLGGRARGRLSVVGIGPGQAGWRTPEVSRLVAEAEELVGYGLYIDLLGPLAAGKARADFPLGGEEARCRHALERAGEGRNVALVCSGDAGIYAMGALVFELLDRAEDAGGVS
uniref:cobalamin biosynthesis protein n=1 Tax=Oceaniglobus roseus TaxID=1737570 RepID=UPI000C7EB3C2